MSTSRFLLVSALAMSAAGGLASHAHAGGGSGTVGQVVVGRQGHQVFVELTNESISDFPCASVHPNGFNFAFSTQSSGGKDMLATVLAAKASGAHLYFVGNGTCNQDSMIEDASYIIAL